MSDTDIVSNSQRRRETHIWEVDAFGHYPEPLRTSVRLFEAERFGNEDDIIVDPCCGWGRIVRAAEAAGYRAIGYDIVDRRDDPQSYNHFEFCRCDTLANWPPFGPVVVSIAMNPPYGGNFIQKFVERALVFAEYKVAALVPLRRLPAARWLRSLPLETIYLLTPRPSLPPASYIRAGYEPGGGGQDFCWLVFNKQKPSTASEPTVRWLCRDGDTE